MRKIIQKIIRENTTISDNIIEFVLILYVDDLIFFKEVIYNKGEIANMLIINNILYMCDKLTTYNIETDEIKTMMEHNKCLRILEYNNNIIINTFSFGTWGEFKPVLYNVKKNSFAILTSIHPQFQLLTNNFNYSTPAITNEYIFMCLYKGIDVINIKTRDYKKKIFFDYIKNSYPEKILISNNKLIIISDKTIELYDLPTLKLHNKICHNLNHIYDAVCQSQFIYILHNFNGKLYINKHFFDNLMLKNENDIDLKITDLNKIEFRIAANNEYLCLVKQNYREHDEGYIKVFLI